MGHTLIACWEVAENWALPGFYFPFPIFDLSLSVARRFGNDKSEMTTGKWQMKRSRT
jgi:hypothetical protein